MVKSRYETENCTLSIDKEEFEFNLETAFAPFLGLIDEDGCMDPAYFEALINFYQAMEWDYIVETYPEGRYGGKEFFESNIGIDKVFNVRLA